MRNATRVLLIALLAAAAANVAQAASRSGHAGRTAGPLPWIQDDYPRAVALAKARRLPIFVEAWAPW